MPRARAARAGGQVCSLTARQEIGSPASANSMASRSLADVGHDGTLAQRTRRSANVASPTLATSSARNTAERHRQHQRRQAYGTTWKHEVEQVRGGPRRSTDNTRGTKPAALAAKGHEPVVAAVTSAQHRRAKGKHAAFEECVDSSLTNCGRSAPMAPWAWARKVAVPAICLALRTMLARAVRRPALRDSCCVASQRASGEQHRRRHRHNRQVTAGRTASKM